MTRLRRDDPRYAQAVADRLLVNQNLDRDHYLIRKTREMVQAEYEPLIEKLTAIATARTLDEKAAALEAYEEWRRSEP